MLVQCIERMLCGSLFQGLTTLLKKYSIAFSVRALFILILRSSIVERVDRWVLEDIETYAQYVNNVVTMETLVEEAEIFIFFIIW